ncbi:tRNA pseudouridine synthase B [Setomelanomma holmii]|uniref:tRNA pseudouridine(55) synthase n=1 Tax=Setomelanomma holmii TaxID=210430 RepID=A0A9P4LG33_9PLEO|nr:tRNA pseudouridine synthase B [Setomelanomma holmii]
MATPPKDSRKVLEGIFAINKPQWASSAGVLRDLQDHFGKSSLFKPWLEATRRDMTISGSKPKLIDRLKVKLGHGGTLDPMATGVLIVGVGKGTKCLQRFLECTKTYECVVLFGAATDSYDAVGKVVSKAPYEHVTKELVEEKLAQFRGKILQKPSIFSALKVDGKKMYEYAREGKDIPEVAARPVEVLEMELVEWLEPDTHDFTWPKEEADGAEREGAEKLLGIRKEDADVHALTAAKRGRKRSRTPENDHVENAGEQPKRPRTDSEPAMSGALPSEDTPAEPAVDEVKDDATEGRAKDSLKGTEVNGVEQTKEAPNKAPPVTDIDPVQPQPPAARLRMTVTSGFYVRSLCHDLGLACSSLGLMSSLIRSRQGDYTLDKNVVNFTDLEKGPEVWEPEVQSQLETFMRQEGWEAEEIEDEETWQSKKKDLLANKKGNDRDRSYQGGGKGKWKGGRNNNYYSKNMKGGRDNHKRDRRDD